MLKKSSITEVGFSVRKTSSQLSGQLHGSKVSSDGTSPSVCTSASPRSRAERIRRSMSWPASKNSFSGAMRQISSIIAGASGSSSSAAAASAASPSAVSAASLSAASSDSTPASVSSSCCRRRIPSTSDSSPASAFSTSICIMSPERSRIWATWSSSSSVSSRMRSITVSKMWAKPIRLSKPNAAAPPLTECTARKAACTVSPSPLSSASRFRCSSSASSSSRASEKNSALKSSSSSIAVSPPCFRPAVRPATGSAAGQRVSSASRSP